LRIVTWLAAACGALGGAGCCSNDDVDHYLEQDGFTPFLVPNNSFGPGSVLAVGASGAVDPICTPAEAFGPSFQPQESETTSIQELASCSGGVSISAELLSVITGTLGFSSVESISVDLTNTHLVFADESQLGDTTARSADCAGAITKALAAKQSLILVKEVYEGDYTYTITYDTSASLSLEVMLTQELTIKLGAQGAATGTNTITGKDLFWGYTSEPQTTP
jgi:hypothetical protein